MNDSLRNKRTVQSAVLAYVDERAKLGEFAPRTKMLAGNTLLAFAESAGADLPVVKLRGRHVVRWLGEMSVAPNTARHRLSMLRTFCHWALARKWIDVDPTAGVKGPRVPRMMPRGLSRGQVEALFSVLPDERAEVMVCLMVQEGLRCIEVVRLQLGDVDFSGDELRVKGKFGHERVLPLSAETRSAITRYLTAHPASYGPLVRSYNDAHKGLSTAHISELVAGWMREAGVKLARYDRVSAHALRHTMATDMLRAGASLRDVQAALGHVSLSTTQIYLPNVVKGLREAMGGRSYRSANPSATAENHAEAS